jgi:UDP-N-acetylmuramoyl-tripeptide--D-alanyl-D-alanine ligase
MMNRFLYRLRLYRPLAQGYLMSACAFIWRRLMFRTTFIAITGSAGKSTATACLGSILSAHYPTNWEPGGRNDRLALARIVLRTRFHHRFTVIEVGTRAPGALARAAWTIAPDIAVVLRVLNIHSNAFPTIEEMAVEKEQLLRRLGKRGLAILNADDPLVLDMGRRLLGRVRTFGVAEDAFLRADRVSAVWPFRLSFRAHCCQQLVPVETSLVGAHWLPSALAALAAAVSCGISLADAASALQSVQPVAGRMQPMILPNGAIVIRDDFNAQIASVQAGLDFLASVQTARRIVVVGDVLDSGLSVRPRARELGRRVAQAADVGVFLGSEAPAAAKSAIAAGMASGSARAFKRLPEASEFLKAELRAGDLILTAGWDGRHIERAILAQFGQVSCWIERCEKKLPCEHCPELKLAALPAVTTAAAGGGPGSIGRA